MARDVSRIFTANRCPPFPSLKDRAIFLAEVYIDSLIENIILVRNIFYINRTGNTLLSPKQSLPPMFVRSKTRTYERIVSMED